MDITSFLIGCKSAAAQSGTSGISPVYVVGSFEATAKSQTVSHGLGVKPDIAILLLANTTSTTKIAVGYVGYSQAMVDAFGGKTLSTAYIVMEQGSTSLGGSALDATPDTMATLYGHFRHTTDTSFTVGGSSFGLDVGKRYSYVLIGGLV